jgi:hypothetical protein
MCLEEEQPEQLNHFVGFREIEVPVVRRAS